MDNLFENDRPIYLQLVEKLRLEIVSGRLNEGERLKSVRELAFEYKVNPNTMQKALTELEEIGLVYTERTNGKFVTNDAKKIKNEKMKLAKTKTGEFINFMAQIGIAKEEALDYLKEMEEKTSGTCKM